MNSGTGCRWSLRALLALERLRHAIARRHPATRRMDHARTMFYHRVWREAAGALGADWQPRENGWLEFHLDGHRTLVDRNFTAIDDAAALDRAGNKPLVARLLAEHGLPVPTWRKFTLASINDAVAFMRAERDYVIKPARDTGAGMGVTTHVCSHAQVFRAAARAAVFSDELCIEEQAAGDNFRLLYLDGVLLEAVLRRPPTITGDGRSTIRALVERANRRRIVSGMPAAQTLLSFDLDLYYTLASQGLTAASIPAAGQVMRLKGVVNDNTAADNVCATDILADAVIEAGARAAATVGVTFAGVDIITPDPSRPLDEAGGVVLEVNTTPGFYSHYFRRGEPCAVAVDVLRHLLGRPGHVCRV